MVKTSIGKGSLRKMAKPYTESVRGEQGAVGRIESGSGEEVKLARAEGGDLYAALLDEFEPGCETTELDRVFGALRPRLSDLLARITAKEPAQVRRGDVTTGIHHSTR